MAIALHHSRAAGTAKLVLLGIANHDGDGGAWPSVRTLCRYAAVDRRNVQRALDKLEQLGEIRREIGLGGDHSTANHLRPNLYRFTLSCPSTCDHSRQHRIRGEVTFEGMEEPAALTPPGGADAAPSRGGDAAPPAAQAPPEPSLNPDHSPKRTGVSTRECRESPSGAHVWESSGWCRYGSHRLAERASA